MDMESASWLAALDEGGTERETALARLHQMLLRVAVHEAYRRGPTFRIGGPELDDLAHQAANDAMVSLLGKLDSFRGESRFTTWAYRFVTLEVANKLGRHFWRNPAVSLAAEDWERLPAPCAADPLAQTQQRELIAAVRCAMTETLTDHQRLFFVAIVVNGVPIEAMVSQYGSNRGAIYKTVFDARRKIRAYLTANGYLEGEPTAAQPTEQRVEVKGHDRVVEVVGAATGRRPA
jgi:RNA polymerase sigma-70 factor (ECF subfamily)